MDYSAMEIMQYIEEEDVKFIRLAFCDVFGKQKNISIMPNEVERAFKYGIAINATSIKGFGAGITSDLFLHPDPSTITVLPWRPEHGRVVRMFCDITYADGSPFENDTRSILKNAINYAKSEGYSFKFGSTTEFYLFKTDEDGNPTSEPYDKAGYMDIAPDDKGENVRREICLTLERMGIYPESSHHEAGPGQNQIDFISSDPLTAADNAITFSSVVRTIASRNGLYADFSPRPIPNQPGNGFHIGFSVRGETDEDVLPSAAAGVLSTIKETTVFYNPTEESYDRVSNSSAPKYITWSKGNRHQLMRLPEPIGGVRIAQLRSPDDYCNPYLAYALVIYAGIYGIKSRLSMPASVDTDFSSADKCETNNVANLPLNLFEAQECAMNSDFIKSVIPQSIIDIYCD